MVTVELPRFLAVGLSGVVVDFVCFSTALNCGMSPVGAKMIAAEIATFNNFLWNDNWTFAQSRGKRRSSWVQRFFRFQVIYAGGIVLAASLLGILRYYTSLNDYLSNVVAISFSTLWNFNMSRSFNWKTQI
jgi:dolichol-phosphate mannosyltransferase